MAFAALHRSTDRSCVVASQLGCVVCCFEGSGNFAGIMGRNESDYVRFSRSTASRISGMRSFPKYMSSPPTNIVGEP